MNCLFKNMRTMCLAMIAGTLLLTVSCKDDDEATVTGFALDQTEVGFLNQDRKSTRLNSSHRT